MAETLDQLLPELLRLIALWTGDPYDAYQLALTCKACCESLTRPYSGRSLILKGGLLHYIAYSYRYETPKEMRLYEERWWKDAPLSAYQLPHMVAQYWDSREGLLRDFSYRDSDMIEVARWQGFILRFGAPGPHESLLYRDAQALARERQLRPLLGSWKSLTSQQRSALLTWLRFDAGAVYTYDSDSMVGSANHMARAAEILGAREVLTPTFANSIPGPPRAPHSFEANQANVEEETRHVYELFRPYLPLIHA